MGENALGKSVCRFFKVYYLKDKVIPQIKVFFLHVDKHQMNNSRILKIKNAKFSGYYFYMN